MKNLKEQSCKDIFQNAYEKRYTWNTDFKGYKGKFNYLFDKHSYEGEFLLGEDFKPEIKNIDDRMNAVNIDILWAFVFLFLIQKNPVINKIAVHPFKIA